MRWAFKTFMNPDARPPTETAKAFKVLAQQDLLAFAEVLGRLEAGMGEEPKTASPKRPKARTQEADDKTASAPEEHAQSGHIKTLKIYPRDLLATIRGEPARWVANLPPGASVIDCKILHSGERMELTIRSDTFDLIAPGAPIPEITQEYISNFPATMHQSRK
jgi:hypothetical protein